MTDIYHPLTEWTPFHSLSPLTPRPPSPHLLLPGQVQLGCEGGKALLVGLLLAGQLVLGPAKVSLQLLSLLLHALALAGKQSTLVAQLLVDLPNDQLLTCILFSHITQLLQQFLWNKLLTTHTSVIQTVDVNRLSLVIFPTHELL